MKIFHLNKDGYDVQEGLGEQQGCLGAELVEVDLISTLQRKQNLHV